MFTAALEQKQPSNVQYMKVVASDLTLSKNANADAEWLDCCLFGVLVFFNCIGFSCSNQKKWWLEKAMIEASKIKDYKGKVNKEQQFSLSSIIRNKDI